MSNSTPKATFSGKQGTNKIIIRDTKMSIVIILLISFLNFD